MKRNYYPLSNRCCPFTTSCSGYIYFTGVFEKKEHPTEYWPLHECTKCKVVESICSGYYLKHSSRVALIKDSRQLIYSSGEGNELDNDYAWYTHDNGHDPICEFVMTNQEFKDMLSTNQVVLL